MRKNAKKEERKREKQREKDHTLGESTVVPILIGALTAVETVEEENNVSW